MFAAGGATSARRNSVSVRSLGHVPEMPSTVTDPAPDPPNLSVASVKWGLIRRLNEEKALLYSLQERNLAAVQAALRNNNSKIAKRDSEAAEAEAAPAGKAWYVIDSRGPFKRNWDLFMSIVLCYSVFMLPLRLGFNAAAHGPLYTLVRVCDWCNLCVLYTCNAVRDRPFPPLARKTSCWTPCLGWTWRCPWCPATYVSVGRVVSMLCAFSACA